MPDTETPVAEATEDSAVSAERLAELQEERESPRFGRNFTRKTADDALDEILGPDDGSDDDGARQPKDFSDREVTELGVKEKDNPLEGYKKDSQGRWHDANGQIVSKEKVENLRLNEREEPADDTETEDDPAPKAQEEETTTDSETDTEPAGSDSEPDTEEYEKALRALRRAKTPQSVIDGMDPNQVVDWGLALAAEQAKSDGFGNRIKALESKLKGDADTEPEETSEDSEPVLEALDFDELTNALADQFGDDERLAKAVTKPILALHQSAAKAMQQIEQDFAAVISDRDDYIRTLVDEMKGLREEVVLGELRQSESFGQYMDDPSAILKLRDKAAKLYETDDYANLRDAYQDAAAIVFRERRESDARQRRETEAQKQKSDHKRRQKSTPTIRGTNRTEPPKNVAQLENDLLDAIETGDDKTARRLKAELEERKRIRT